MKYSLTVLSMFIVLPVYSMDLLSKVGVVQPQVKIKIIEQVSDIEGNKKVVKSSSKEETTKTRKEKKNNNQQPLLLAQNVSKKLCKAIKGNDPDRVKKALKNGAALNFQDAEKGKTFLMHAIKNLNKYVKNNKVANEPEFQKGVEIFRLLLAKEDKHDFFLTDKKNCDALEYAEKFNMHNVASIIAFIQTFQATDFDKIQSASIKTEA